MPNIFPENIPNRTKAANVILSQLAIWHNQGRLNYVVEDIGKSRTVIDATHTTCWWGHHKIYARIDNGPAVRIELLHRSYMLTIEADEPSFYRSTKLLLSAIEQFFDSNSQNQHGKFFAIMPDCKRLSYEKAVQAMNRNFTYYRVQSIISKIMPSRKVGLFSINFIHDNDPCSALCQRDRAGLDRP